MKHASRRLNLSAMQGAKWVEQRTVRAVAFFERSTVGPLAQLDEGGVS